MSKILLDEVPHSTLDCPFVKDIDKPCILATEGYSPCIGKEMNFGFMQFDKCPFCKAINVEISIG